MSELAALQAALAVEHQSVYGYGIAGAHLSGHLRETCLRRLDEHSAQRDRLAALVTAAGGTPVAAAPAYALPFPVTDATSAERLAARLEDAGTGTAWDLAAASTPGSAARRLAVAQLSDAAGWAARWHARAGDPPPPPLPGQPV